MAELNYKTTEAVEGDYSPLPAGEYVAIIKTSDVKNSKSSGKPMLALGWEILSPGYEGKLVFENLNIAHESTQAREIAQKALNTICNLAGFPEGVKNSEQLHGKPMILKLVVKDNPEYGPQNQIKAHLPYEGKKVAPAAQSAQAAPQGKKNPWEE